MYGNNEKDNKIPSISGWIKSTVILNGPVKLKISLYENAMIYVGTASGKRSNKSIILLPKNL